MLHGSDCQRLSGAGLGGPTDSTAGGHVQGELHCMAKCTWTVANLVSIKVNVKRSQPVIRGHKYRSMSNTQACEE